MSGAGRPGVARRGLLLIISSPSGAGKSSLASALRRSHPELGLSVSATTRPPRPGETPGKDYVFLSAQAFDAAVAAGDFLEWAVVHEHRYGTPRAPVEGALAQGQDLLFDIDWQGAAALRRHAPADTVSVFILPPSIAELASRLHGRAQDSQAVIDRRLGRARGEIAHWPDYDYVLVNSVFETALADLAAIYRAERARTARNLWLEAFASTLTAE
jgi:guanylate kinase